MFAKRKTINQFYCIFYTKYSNAHDIAFKINTVTDKHTPQITIFTNHKNHNKNSISENINSKRTENLRQNKHF